MDQQDFFVAPAKGSRLKANTSRDEIIFPRP
jgi:hypothetical protein